MPSAIPNVAVLFFTRSAEAEGNYKQFFPADDAKNASVAHHLITHTHRQLDRIKLPVITIAEKQQHGTTFGERFTNAFQQAFSRGYDYIIAIGNDTPELTAQHIKKAARLLQSGKTDVVLGPASDGGAWLMGYSRKAFNPVTFKELPWNTSRLTEAMQESSDEFNAVYLLEEFDDIDDACSLIKFLDKRFADALLEKLTAGIRSVIATVKTTCASYFESFCPSFIKSALFLRAPPCKI